MDFHACDPPMEQRAASDPAAWRCPECGTWWEAVPSVPAQVPPTYDFLTHQGIVPAKWVPREDA
jgi:hypothetical protein